MIKKYKTQEIGNMVANATLRRHKMMIEREQQGLATEGEVSESLLSMLSVLEVVMTTVSGPVFAGQLCSELHSHCMKLRLEAELADGSSTTNQPT